MEIIDKLTAILNRLESLKQLNDADINYLEEQIDQIEYDDLPHLKNEINKYQRSFYDGRDPDEKEKSFLNQIDGALAQIDAAINMVHKQLGINDSEEDDGQFEYVDGGVYAVPEPDEYTIVLKEVAISALKTIGINNKDNHAVSVMETILFGILSGEKDNIIVAKAFNELLLSGFMLDREQLVEMCKNTRENCQMQLLGLQIAVDSIREYKCSALEALSQISVFL